MYYASIGALSLILHIIINHDILFFRRSKDMSPAEICYRRFLYSVMLYYASDIMWGTLYELRLIPLVYADTVIYFAAMVLSVLFWTRFVVAYLGSSNTFGKVLIYAGWMIFIYEISNLVLNFFIPIMFSFDSNMIYRPKNARYAALGIQIVMFFVTAVYTFIVSLKTEGKVRRHHRTICLSGVIMTLFIVLQTFYPFLPYYAAGCLITTCLVNTFVAQDEKLERERELVTAMQMAYTDSLTGVKNPHAYADEKHILDSRISDGTLKGLSVIVFDINELKHINDTLGHEAGDGLINEACKIICEYFGEDSVYRIGGDEFVAVLEGESYAERNALLATFEKLMEANQKAGLVVISSGLAEYRPQEDNDYDAIFERADRLMYERKKELKANKV